MTIANHYQAGWEKADFLQTKEKKKIVKLKPSVPNYAYPQPDAYPQLDHTYPLVETSAVLYWFPF